MDATERQLVASVMESRSLLVRALIGGVVSPAEYPEEEVERSFAHVSHHCGDSARMCRDAFLEAVQAEYEAGVEFVENAEQKAALDAAIVQFKRDYLECERPVTRAHAASYSGYVAGGSKLDTRQVQRRGNALDRATEAISAWLRSAQGNAKAAVMAARSPEQLDAEQQKLDDKAARKKAAEEAMMRRLLNFKPGDEAKFGLYPIAKVSFTRDGYPSTVTVAATDLWDNKFDAAKIIFGGDKARLRATVDAVRAADAAESAMTQPRAKSVSATGIIGPDSKPTKKVGMSM